MIASLLRRCLIHRFTPPRSVFDKTNYIENYVPPPHSYRTRQSKWDDPNYNWPPKLPKYTKFQNKALVTEVETEYLKAVQKEKKFPEIKTGDLIEVTTYQSMSGKQVSVFQGVCIARKKKHTINSSLNVIGEVQGIQMEMHIKLYSPMVKEIKVIKYGTGNFRSRLNYFRGMTLSTYTALEKGVNKRQKPTYIAKKEEQAMRYKIIKGEIFGDEEEEEKKQS